MDDADPGTLVWAKLDFEPGSRRKDAGKAASGEKGKEKGTVGTGDALLEESEQEVVVRRESRRRMRNAQGPDVAACSSDRDE